MDDHGGAKAGMGVAVADMDDDGDADVLVVNLEGETDSYHRNDGGYFTDATAQAGLTVHGRRHTRFGAVAQDFDNDGWLDIYQANGKVDGDLTAATDPFAEPNLLYRGAAQDSGIRFSPARPRAGTTAPLVHTSRAAAVGDVDNDGRLDVLVVNRDSPAYLLMNRTSSGNWARFRLLDSQGADVPGAVVLATVGSRR
ncbi:MAG: VCBS repeat-containing protein, partial [Gammaproteobacteria bacterium]|nr:VCBS repeat-containing protein [Gammaproteobacteria bacterium]